MFTGHFDTIDVQFSRRGAYVSCRYLWHHFTL